MTLPDGWVWTTIGESADINQRNPSLRDLPNDLEVTFVPMAAVDADTGTIAEPQIRPFGEVRKGFTPFSNGDVLFAKITPSMENGKVAIAKDLKNGLGFGSTEFHTISAKEGLLATYIYYFIRQECFRKDAKAHFAGTAGQLRVPSSFLINYPFPLPPLPEQERIVRRIESLFTQLEAGVAGLRRAQAALKRYRASVLKAACEGRLVPTEAELARQEGRGYETAEELLRRILAEKQALVKGAASAKKTHARGNDEEADAAPLQLAEDLPEGWVWVKLGSIFRVTIGGTPSRSKPEYWSGNISWINSGEVRNNRIKYAREKITDIGVAHSNAKTNPPNTVLLAMIGEGKTRGQAAILDISASTNQNIASIHCYETPILSEWVFYWLIDRYEETRKSGSGGMQYALNSERIRNFNFPIPPLEEQRRIVAEVERRLSLATELEAAVSASLRRAGRLRQAILKRAFEGRLVR